MIESLQQLFSVHRGKVSDKWQLYLAEYDRLLSGFRDKPVRLLEIGVQNGGSLEIWSKYFSSAEVIAGCDIDPNCADLQFEDPRISVIVGDINSAATESQILDISAEYDIVIDDGSHHSGDIIRSFSRYFRHLAEGGVFFIEDVHCSYWQEFEGGLYDPMSSISFLKALADVANFPNWGIEKAREDILTGFSSRYGLEIDAESLRQIQFVGFLNSMCVVKKSVGGSNLLGSRMIAGQIEPTAPGHLEIPGDQELVVPLQASNFWSNRESPPGEELPGLLQDQAKQVQKNIELEARLTAVDAEFVEVKRRFREQSVHLIELEKDLQERNDLLLDLKLNLKGRDKQILSLNQAAGEREKRLANADQQVEGLWALQEYFKNTLSWRATAFFRNLWARKNFNRKFYLEQNPDVAENGMDPFEHYVAFGSREGREPRPQTFVDKQQALLSNVRRAVSNESGLFRFIGTLLAVMRREGLSGLKEFIGLSMGWEEIVGYSEWVATYDTLTDEDRERIQQRIESMGAKPLISIVMPTYNTRMDWLKEAIESVRAQLYDQWELCIADDASTDPEVGRLLKKLSAEDPRIKVIIREENGHISQASNSALQLCTGDWVALLDHDDRLAEHALFCVADVIGRHADAQLIYSDEDKISDSGERSDPYFKCDWNLDLFYSHNMISHLGVYRKKVLEEIGGFREGLEGSQDYDLALRVIEKIDQKGIYHIPRVLYHWRAHAESTARGLVAKPYAQIAAEKALKEHFERRGVAARIDSLPYGYKVNYELPASLPLVSLIVPTRNGLRLLKTCIESILACTSYPNYEIVIVDNGSDDLEILEYFSILEKKSNVRLLRDDRPFNFSMLNNLAVAQANGEILGFINNDIEVITAGWLSELVSVAMQSGVGAVGAKLLYPDDTVQHAGVVLGVGGIGNHAFLGKPANAPGYFNRAKLVSSFSALTAACLVVRKEIFLEVGGFDEENLPVAFNDVDFCLRAREMGYRNVLNPSALLYHHESASRGDDDTPEKKARFEAEIQYMEQQWGHLLQNDPAYSPNLTLQGEDFSLAWPPRVQPLGREPHSSHVF